MAGRQLEIPEVEELIAKRQVGPLQGFRSKLGRPFAAVIKLTPELKPEFDFGQDRTEANGAVAEVDFTGQEPLGKCPQVRPARIRDGDALRLREGDRRAAARAISGRARSSCSEPIERAQMQKLLADRQDGPAGEVHLQEGPALQGFPGGQGRERRLRIRAARGQAAESRRPRAESRRRRSRRLISRGSSRWANARKCGKRVFEGGAAYVCEQSQADKRPCKFKINKVILQQPIDRAQAARLLAEGKTDLFHEFISAKSGRPFPAYLVMDETGKVGFEFPPRREARDGESVSRRRSDCPSQTDSTAGQRQVD